MAKSKKEIVHFLFSTLDHPQELTYGKNMMIVPPRVKNLLVDASMLPKNLPKGIRVIEKVSGGNK